MAKFSGAMIFYMVTWLPLMPCLFIAHYYSGEQSLLDAGTIAATFLGILLIGSVYVAMGCFASSLTRSHLVAVMVGTAMGGLLFLLSYMCLHVTAPLGWKAKLVNHISLIEHMKDFAGGVVDSRPVVLCLSLAALFLFLTLKVVESRRWK
jgi:ABC-2 type transport system permease protein